MRTAIQILLAMTLLPGAMTQMAHAQGAAGPIHVATYLEVGTASEKDAIKLIKQYRDATRKENGNVRSETAQEIGRANRFLVLEIWKDQGAFEAHGKSAGTGTFRDKLKAIQNAPLDERVHSAFNVGPGDP